MVVKLGETFMVAGLAIVNRKKDQVPGECLKCDRKLEPHRQEAIFCLNCDFEVMENRVRDEGIIEETLNEMKKRQG